MSNSQQAKAEAGQRQFPCKQCGANLQYMPGTKTLTCPYCGTINEIPESQERVEEVDFRTALANLAAKEPVQETLAVKCNVCGAETNLSPNTVADKCPFCGSAIVATATSRKSIKPRALLPFYIKREQAVSSFRQWLSGLWFAPSELANRADSEAMKGVYLPAWTYDADTWSAYTGERGDDYWDTEHYTAMENGRAVRRTRQVRRTRWWPVSGDVSNRFDDVLVVATRSLPDKYVAELEPWDLKQLLPYSDEYLSGFVAQSYQVDLGQGFEVAKQIIDEGIRQTIALDIGGDHQRIFSVSTRYGKITFKHVLLPVWISAYRYGDRTFRFLVNARSGEVQGERPWSVVKIALAIIGGIILALIVFLIVQSQR
jgi:LSD1 subclass zinc finger protein